MSKTIKYTGTQVRWAELPYTGKQSVWQPGEQDERSDTEANQLLATGLFTQVYTVNDLPLPSLVSGAGINTIALIGDSLTDNNYTNAAGLQAYSSIGYFTWANMLLGQRLTLVNEGGVGGNKSADVLARLDRDMIAYRPKYGLVMIGVNDLFGSLTATAIAANLQEIYTRMRAAGITVIACTVTPASAAQIEQWTALNAWIVDYARSTTGMLLCDMAGALMSATDGAPLAGTTNDGIHPITQGAVPMGRSLFEVLDPIVPKIAPGTAGLMTVGSAQKNIVLNGNAWGNNAGGVNGFSLGAGITGTGPDRWQTGRSGTSTAVASKVAKSDWRSGEMLRLACTVGGANEQLFCGPLDTILRYWASGLAVNLNDIVRPTVPNGVAYRVTTAGALAAGADPTATWSTTPGASFTSGAATLKVVDPLDTGASLIAQCRIALSAWTGAVLPVLQIWQYTSGYGSIVKKSNCNNWGGADALPTNVPAGTYVLRTPTVTLDPTCAIITVRMGIYGAAGVTGNLDVGEFELRRDTAPYTFSPTA
jgi:lysophospholipase L1-like esterase